MIIKVEQTESNLKSKFEIRVNNVLKYFAGSPWMKIDVPLDVDEVRRCIITDLNENICYATSYNVGENVANDAIPMKWAITGSQKTSIYKVIDKENNLCGKFYRLINGIIDTKYVIEYNDETFICYSKSVGKTRNIFVYKDDVQVAEIVKPLSTVNNLDNYYIYLLDNYSYLETIISFFTIYFDYKNYANSGEIVKGKTEVGFSYTYDKNNKFYDKNWISNNFNKEDVQLINQNIVKSRDENMEEIKKQAKIILAIFAAGWLLIFIILGIVHLL
ncbi:MAG: hypothetical protein LBL91_02380 [Lachnospiraceae bacterium]|jgi:hypothetical protein|nr:hypothetical protein [Lachnospiraceae bacterium]